jgi:hypothetical protein
LPAAGKKTKAKPRKKQVKASAPAAKRRIGCDKAMATVQDYAFAVVVARNCKSNEYVFEASRDEQRYEVKVDSRSGQMTAGKKLKPTDGQAARAQ